MNAAEKPELKPEPLKNICNNIIVVKCLTWPGSGMVRGLVRHQCLCGFARRKIETRPNSPYFYHFIYIWGILYKVKYYIPHVIVRYSTAQVSKVRGVWGPNKKAVEQVLEIIKDRKVPELFSLPGQVRH